MEEILIEKIDINLYIDKYWKKTLIYKMSFGTAKPSKGWIKQLHRILRKKIPTSSPQKIGNNL